MGLGNSAVALGVQGIIDCNNNIGRLDGPDGQVVFSAGNGTASAIMDRGGDSWFFLTADYAFGHAL